MKAIRLNFWVLQKRNEISFRQKEIDLAASLSLQHRNNNAYMAIEAHVPDLKSKVTSLSVLYDALIGPIEDLLLSKNKKEEDIEDLIIILDGPLYFVPYAAK